MRPGSLGLDLQAHEGHVRVKGDAVDHILFFMLAVEHGRAVLLAGVQLLARGQAVALPLVGARFIQDSLEKLMKRILRELISLIMYI